MVGSTINWVTFLTDPGDYSCVSLYREVKAQHQALISPGEDPVFCIRVSQQHNNEKQASNLCCFTEVYFRIYGHVLFSVIPLHSN